MTASRSSVALTRIVASATAFAIFAITGLVASADGHHTPYSTRISNSVPGGDPGFFYIGGPTNVTLQDTRDRAQRYELCMVPAPTDRPSCTTGRTGRPVTGLAPSRSGLTKLRFELPAGGPVIVRHINVRPVRSGRIRVCAEKLDVFEEPNRKYVGQLRSGQSIKVHKYSASGKYAYGFAYGNANKIGWVLSSGLCGT